MSKKGKKNSKVQSEIKECKYFVDGMHCASCEVLIEKKVLKKLENVEYVDASLTSGEITLRHTGEKPSADELSEMFKESGYRFSTRKYYTDQSPLVSFDGGFMKINREKFDSLVKTILIFIIFLIAFKILESSGIVSGFTVSSTSSYPAFFLFGVIAGLSSCAALVGGLLLSLSKQWSEVYIESDSKNMRLVPFTMFNVGRIISFALLGGVLGWLGSKLGLSLDGTSILTSVVIILVSLLMGVLALQMLGVSWASKFQIAIPKFISRKITNTDDFNGKYMPFMVGALTFFLPCGFTITAQALALTSGSFLTGFMILLFFALGTLPILAIISLTSVQVTRKPKLNAMFNQLAGILVLFFALYNLNSQLNVLGFSSLSDIKTPTVTNNGGTGKNVVKVDDDGVQRIKMVADNFEYRLIGATRIKAGVPAQLVVTNNGVRGCGAYLYARGLVDTYAFLNDGENIIDIPNPKKGIYKVTCTMGMVPPVTVEVF